MYALVGIAPPHIHRKVAINADRCLQEDDPRQPLQGQRPAKHRLLSYVYPKQPIFGLTQEWFRELSFSRLECGVHDKLHISSADWWDRFLHLIMLAAWSGNRTRVSRVISERANHCTTAPLWLPSRNSFLDSTEAVTTSKQDARTTLWVEEWNALGDRSTEWRDRRCDHPKLTLGQRHRRALVHLEEFESAEFAESTLSGHDENVEAFSYRYNM